MKYRSVFDIIGPVMVGPSSSHTAGAVRIGLVARDLFGRMRMLLISIYMVHLWKHIKDMEQMWH